LKNESNGTVGYNLIDTEVDVGDSVIDQLRKLDKVIFVRKIQLV
jgi:transcriptional regulator NrdR family protein